jgi:MFS family permease
MNINRSTFQIYSIAIIFFLEAFGFTAWLPRMPELKETLSLTEQQIGILLSGLPVGALIAMVLTGWATKNYSSRLVLLISITTLGLTLPLIAFAKVQIQLFLSLLCLGLGTGSMGVSMNYMAFVVEKGSGQLIMSRCHAMFSAGGIAGALFGSLCFANQISLLYQVLLTSLILLLFSFPLCLFLPSVFEQSTSPRFALPKQNLLVISMLVFLSLMLEGIIVDWSSLYSKEVLAATPQTIGLGFACFSVAMTIGRLFGDRLSLKYNSKQVLRYGGLIATSGAVIVSLSKSVWHGMPGFFLIGIGLSTFIPILLRETAFHVENPSEGIAAVSTVGYLGFLAAPPTIGLLSKMLSFRISFGITILIPLIISIFASPALKQLSCSNRSLSPSGKY